MANVNRPAGLTPRRHGGGGTPMRMVAYAIASGLTENIYSGDPVILGASGKEITLVTAGATNRITGIFAGVKYVDANGEQQFRPRWISGTVATEIEALVYDDPNMEFVAQVDGVGLAAADIGANANLVAGAGNNFTGRSGWQIDATGIAPDATFQVTILDLASSIENEFGEFAKALCRINLSTNRAAVVGV